MTASNMSDLLLQTSDLMNVVSSVKAFVTAVTVAYGAGHQKNVMTDGKKKAEAD